MCLYMKDCRKIETKFMIFSYKSYSLKTVKRIVGICLSMILAVSAAAQDNNYRFDDAVQWVRVIKNANQKELQENETVKIGEVISIEWQGTIQAGFHVYSSIPPAKQANYVTQFELDKTSKGVVVMGKLKENGNLEKQYDSIFETNVQYFSKKATFRQEIKISGKNPLIIAELSYQICDDNGCVSGKQEVNFPLKTKK